MNLLEAMQTRDARTANGALTHSTSYSACVDMFFLAGASRGMSEKDMINLFVKAYSEHPEVAMKILFWSRDCRGGAGERKFFQTVYAYFLKNYAKANGQSLSSVQKLNALIPEYGYWKDCVKLGLVKPMANALLSNNSLAAKWCPREGAYAELVRNSLDMSPRAFRKLLVELSNTVETKMCARQWDQIVYKQVPSVAFKNYKKAYERHDTNRFNQFISDVQEGKTTLHSGQLFPYQLYQAYRRNERPDIINEQWKALPDYLADTDEQFLPIVDVSGSMENINFNGNNGNDKYGVQPMDIAVSLGVYFSERNKSIYKDAFITFSTEPTLQVLKGTACQRFNQLRNANWKGSTNLQAVFALVLAKAIENNVSQADMPSSLIIISDMEFNACISGTNYDNVKAMYTKYGYKLPQVVFWNVNGRVGNVPARATDKNVALVSGAAPAVVKSVLTGQNKTPIDVMLDTVLSERYKPITLS